MTPLVEVGADYCHCGTKTCVDGNGSVWQKKSPREFTKTRETLGGKQNRCPIFQASANIRTTMGLTPGNQKMFDFLDR